MSSFIEEVILVDEQDNQIGTMPKSEVHSMHTPLHRAFSCFLFNEKGQTLLQQRSHKKKTWPLVWSNSFCGHPLPGEKTIDAVKRRMKFEIGINDADIHFISPYRYCFERFSVVENEICPIYVGFTADEPVINTDEVEMVRWEDWESFLNILDDDSEGVFSEWCKEEAQIIHRNDKFQKFFQAYIS